MRDLSLTQLMLRDYKAFQVRFFSKKIKVSPLRSTHICCHQETRKQLLVLKPAQRTHWLGYALAHHLDGNFPMALQILETYEKTLDVRVVEHPFRISCLCFFSVFLRLTRMLCAHVFVCVCVYPFHAAATRARL